MMSQLVVLADVFVAVTIAYIVPGAGLSAIGALLALVFGLIVAVFGFVWYPIR